MQRKKKNERKERERDRETDGERKAIIVTAHLLG